MDLNTLYRAVALSDNTAAIIYQWSSGNRALIMSSNEKVVSMQQYVQIIFNLDLDNKYNYQFIKVGEKKTINIFSVG